MAILTLKNDEIRQKLIENPGFFFIAINPDLDPDAGFDPDVGIEKLYNCINESSPTLAVTSAERSLKEKFAKVLLSYMSSIPKPLNYNKYLIALPTL